MSRRLSRLSCYLHHVAKSSESSEPVTSTMHFIVRFEARDGCEDSFRAALHAVADASRRELGCVGFRVFEAAHDPRVFAIHSEWTNDAAFDLHATLPHTRRFLTEGAALLTHEIHGLRLRNLSAEADPPAERA